jgi:hypothetical protein
LVTFTNNANQIIRLTVVGTNSAATGYWISTDRFLFTQLQAGLPSPPEIWSATSPGGSFVFKGSNGIPTAAYLVLASTNLMLPPGSWNVIATNNFDATGNFNFTPPVGGGTQFYRLKCQLLELP